MENGDEEEPTKQAEGLQTTKEPQQESIMEQKHKQALEQYVEEKLAGIVGDKVVSANEKALLAEQLAKSENNSNKALSKEELYQQLAKAAEAMIGKNSSDEENAVKEGDVGAGGAMLVSGTGLAEVVLPVEQRLKAVQATREAALAKGPKVHREDNMMPKSQVPIPGGVKGFFAVPSARRDFVDRKDNDKNKSNVAVQQPSSENALDNDRAGFDVSRGKTTGTGGMSYTNTEGSTNKRPYQQNKNKATDDKVYGNFVKHHRENQMRGRR